MRLLIVASDPMEFSGVLAGAADVEPLRLPLDWARRTRLGGREAILAANGAGAARAAAAVDACLAAFPADAVISTGYCGALSPELNIGDIVVATCISDGARFYSSGPVKAGAPHHCGPVRSLDHVAGAAEEKRVLRKTGAIAVEMEAAGVAARTLDHGLPLFCIRAVTDLADESMANDFNAALRPDGHFDTMHILGSLLRHPTARLPELIRLRRRCIRASRALGDFIADFRI